ncbi:MAG: histidine kinase [Pegethrix bostrychoides GSE-TBD4-15B]|jgi:signal transduction histidine kinase|uniref:histidine kinase n=1 Tax=Pegethrix bostrychoides GSE-TBD4-15B TaxID=2839662 RepID=A0A951U5Z3_9CYAN|nr:histidine kinase [Pegethrix bostrychoides GSE-TBD4-15B]
MPSTHPPDQSLYELAIATDPSLQLLQLSPTTFKSMVSLLFDFLIEQSLPATIWVKLPRGEVWQAEIARFCEQSSAPYSLYSLQTEPKPELPLAASSQPPLPVNPLYQTVPTADITLPVAWNPSRRAANTEAADELFDDFADLPSTTIDRSGVQTLPLSADSQLKREYFVLVVSAKFQGLISAYRSRLLQPEGGQPSESSERIHPLLGLCCLDPTILQPVLETGIHAAICSGQPDASSAELQPLLISWQSLMQTYEMSADPVLLGRLLAMQMQRQEDLWRSSMAQRRLAEAMPQLQQENTDLLNDLQGKDEFIKNIGLELRTPLSTMKTALSLLNSPSIKPPQRQRYMEMLSQECDRQGLLISGVLDLVQLESGADLVQMEPLRLSEIVPGVVSTYQPLAQEKGVMLAYVVPEDLPPVSCATAWLRQIVINLLHNSIKFTPKGGQVWVRAKQQGDLVQMEFRDSGIGIASADLPRIFNRFYRVRGIPEDANGVGLGLAIVRQLLLRSGGSIGVRSKPGEGSVFTVQIPIYQQ